LLSATSLSILSSSFFFSALLRSVLSREASVCDRPQPSYNAQQLNMTSDHK
jgi:hypothetical protein